jgi:hypothetical protein
MTSFTWISCQQNLKFNQLEASEYTPNISSQSTVQQLTHTPNNNEIRFGNNEGTLSNATTSFRTASQHPVEYAKRTIGERQSPSFRGTGKAFTANRAPRSAIHFSIGGFVQRTTIPIISFSSHTLFIYVCVTFLSKCKIIVSFF